MKSMHLKVIGKTLSGAILWQAPDGKVLTAVEWIKIVKEES